VFVDDEFQQESAAFWLVLLLAFVVVEVQLAWEAYGLLLMVVAEVQRARAAYQLVLVVVAVVHWA
jgi:hypothetical protein